MLFCLVIINGEENLKDEEFKGTFLLESNISSSPKDFFLI